MTKKELKRSLKRALAERDMANSSRLQLELGYTHVQRLLDAFVESMDIQSKRRKKAREWLDITTKALKEINQ